MSLVRVALLPDAFEPAPDGVCAVVDVIRASTTLVAMAEAGARAIHVVADLDEARRTARSLGARALLCGERGGLPPHGFDRGNSPREFPPRSLAGRQAVLSTTNGAAAIERWRTTRRTFVGALRNAGAAARRLLDETQAGAASITIVCAGRDGELALDDVYTAGAIVRRIVRARPDAELDETALAALHVQRGYASARQALELSTSGQLLKPVGLFADVAHCAEEDVSITVPEVGRGGLIHTPPRSEGRARP